MLFDQMRLLLIGLAVLFLSSSCGTEVPKGVIPQQQMTALLLDMHLADGQLASIPIDSARAYRDVYYDAIFTHYAVDSTTFKNSIDYYATRPSTMNEVYVSIEKEMEAMNKAEQKAMEDKYAAQRRADSVVNARRTDSLQRIARDSADFKRMRYLLLTHAPDSNMHQSDTVVYELWRRRMLEEIRLGNVLHSPVLPKTNSTPPPTKPIKQETVIPKSKPLLRSFEKIK